MQAKVENLEKLMQFSAGAILSKVILKSEYFNHTLMCLVKDTSISTHTSSRQATINVLKGTGTFVLNDKNIEMSPGTFIFMEKNTPHSLSASEDLAILLSLFGKEE